MFDGQIGALEIGIVVSTFLFGITTTQTYLYYQLFPHDRKWLKRLVALVWLLEFGHSISALDALYVYTITSFGNEAVPTMKVPFAIAINLVISEVVFICTQSYFAIRLQKLSQKWFVSTCCQILLFARFIWCMIAFVEAVKMTSLEQYVHDWNWVLISMLSIGAFINLAMPIALVYYLSVQRSTAIKTTAAIVDKLILWTIETGLATGILTLLILIFFLVFPGKFAWMSVYICLPKMFSNCFLANLNSRVKLRAMNENTEVVELTPSDTENQRRTILFPQRVGTRLAVTVSKHVTTVEDDGRACNPSFFNMEEGCAKEDISSTSDQKNVLDM